MVLSSDDKAHRVIKARRSANDFLSFFAVDGDKREGNHQQLSLYFSEKKAGPVYITNFKLQKVDYNHLGTDIFETKSR